jgi:dTDP-4-amino-4,6-dideoxygalactose transaminase
MPQLAINGGRPVRTKPFHKWPVHDETEEKYLRQVLNSANWKYGEKVENFEKQFACFQDAKFGIATANGTLAIEAALLAIGINADDEVIVPPYTFVATASAPLRVNAVPIFVDIDPETLCMDPYKIERAVTEKTKAIIPVHFAGYPADMDMIMQISRKHNLYVVEDACHSWGTKWKGKGTGALGDMGAFSFQASKNITSGEGGIILSDNEELANEARSYTYIGRVKGKGWYEHFKPGSNFRMSEFQAAILLAQLTRLKKQTELRTKNALYLNQQMASLEGFIPVDKPDQRITARSYHLYVIRYEEKKLEGISRDKFLEALIAEGIPVSGGYPHPLYKNPLFSSAEKQYSNPYPFYKRIDYKSLYLPQAEKICRQAIFITQNVLLGTKKDMDDIINAIKKIKENLGELKN